MPVTRGQPIADSDLQALANLANAKLISRVNAVLFNGNDQYNWRNSLDAGNLGTSFNYYDASDGYTPYAPQQNYNFSTASSKMAEFNRIRCDLLTLFANDFTSIGDGSGMFRNYGALCSGKWVVGTNEPNIELANNPNDYTGCLLAGYPHNSVVFSIFKNVEFRTFGPQAVSITNELIFSDCSWPVNAYDDGSHGIKFYSEGHLTGTANISLVDKDTGATTNYTITIELFAGQETGYLINWYSNTGAAYCNIKWDVMKDSSHTYDVCALMADGYSFSVNGKGSKYVSTSSLAPFSIYTVDKYGHNGEPIRPAEFLWRLSDPSVNGVWLANTLPVPANNVYLDNVFLPLYGSLGVAFYDSIQPNQTWWPYYAVGIPSSQRMPTMTAYGLGHDIGGGYIQNTIGLPNVVPNYWSGEIEDVSGAVVAKPGKRNTKWTKPVGTKYACLEAQASPYPTARDAGFIPYNPKNADSYNASYFFGAVAFNPRQAYFDGTIQYSVVVAKNTYLKLSLYDNFAPGWTGGVYSDGTPYSGDAVIYLVNNNSTALGTYGNPTFGQQIEKFNPSDSSTYVVALRANKMEFPTDTGIDLDTFLADSQYTQPYSQSSEFLGYGVNFCILPVFKLTGFLIQNPGNGYQVGDVLTMQGGILVPLGGDYAKAAVSSVTSSGGIQSLTPIYVGDYVTTPDKNSYIDNFDSNTGTGEMTGGSGSGAQVLGVLTKKDPNPVIETKYNSGVEKRKTIVGDSTVDTWGASYVDIINGGTGYAANDIIQWPPDNPYLYFRALQVSLSGEILDVEFLYTQFYEGSPLNPIESGSDWFNLVNQTSISPSGGAGNGAILSLRWKKAAPLTKPQDYIFSGAPCHAPLWGTANSKPIPQNGYCITKVKASLTPIKNAYNIYVQVPATTDAVIELGQWTIDTSQNPVSPPPDGMGGDGGMGNSNSNGMGGQYGGNNLIFVPLLDDSNQPITITIPAGQIHAEKEVFIPVTGASELIWRFSGSLVSGEAKELDVTVVSNANFQPIWFNAAYNLGSCYTLFSPYAISLYNFQLSNIPPNNWYYNVNFPWSAELYNDLETCLNLLN